MKVIYKETICGQITELIRDAKMAAREIAYISMTDAEGDQLYQETDWMAPCCSVIHPYLGRPSPSKFRSLLCGGNVKVCGVRLEFSS